MPALDRHLAGRTLIGWLDLVLARAGELIDARAGTARTSGTTA